MIGLFMMIYGENLKIPKVFLFSDGWCSFGKTRIQNLLHKRGGMWILDWIFFQLISRLCDRWTACCLISSSIHNGPLTIITMIKVVLPLGKISYDYPVKTNFLCIWWVWELSSALKGDVHLRDHVRSKDEYPCPFQVDAIHLLSLKNKDNILAFLRRICTYRSTHIQRMICFV